MENPWFKLNANNFNDRWWLYSSILNTETAKKEKNVNDIICILIIQDTNDVGMEYWRCNTWYKDDPNRYLNVIYNKNEWTFDKPLVEMKEGDIVTSNNNKYKVYNSKFSFPDQVDFLKIMERIDE